MWTETLKIRPVLDAPSLKAMEYNLTGRFANVARRFGMGLKSIAKGALFGISVALLNKLLNPIQEIEERIKSLLGEGSDVRDLADKFGSTPGEFMRLQSVAASAGVKPEDLNEAMNKFAEEVRTNPVFSQFAGEKNMVKNFESLLKSLNALSVAERAPFEREIFGSAQTGAMRKLIGLDFQSRAKEIGADPTKLNNAVERAASLADIHRVQDARRANNAFVSQAGALSQSKVSDLVATQERQDRKMLDNLQRANYENIRNASDGINILIDELHVLTKLVTSGFGEVGLLIKDIRASGGVGKVLRNLVPWGR